MRLDLLDRHSRLRSPVHDRPAWLKLAVAIALVVTTVSMPLTAWGWFAGAGAALVAVAALSRVPPGFLARRLLLVEPFVLGVAMLSLLQPGGGRIFAAIVARSTLSVCAMILLAATTPFTELLRVLRRLRVPALIVTTLALFYRYLFVLADEAERMRRARAARTFTPRRRTWRALGTLAARLFVRSTERSERIHAAMAARGWS